jgi:hypothetical protein
MRMIKMALLGGAAMAVTAAGAQANDLDALKAQIDSLNARIAAMETAPSVPAGYQLIAVSEGDMQETPGLGFTAQERAAYGNKSTVISVLPTADAPAGTTISWSGFARAGLVYDDTSADTTLEGYTSDDNGETWATTDVLALGEDADGNAIEVNTPAEYNGDADDIDVKARGQIRVKASTDTAVGEVGVDIRMRVNFNGNGDGDVYSDVAWGYWAMTPELTFGGGYSGSLGNIGYGYDGACTCNYTDNADLAFNPGDVTQMRLSYASGPFGMAIALEDASVHAFVRGDGDTINGDKLGAAGELTYSGDVFSGEISGVWRDANEDEVGSDALWQVGAGVGFGLGDIAKLSIAAAMGEGPFATVDDGELVNGIPYNQSWWGVSALASMSLNDEISVELGAGYKNREGDEFDVMTGDEKGTQVSWTSEGAEYETFGVIGGIYYEPVDQLTIGVEGEWYTTTTEFDLVDEEKTQKAAFERETDTFTAAFVSVWRF